ncbi:hypothetical protein [Thermus filiformis]|uniref:Uncharacterized protein n=1 Tax=Thermus filiformis TaxID=276 RepID=A0A0D6XA75_THEFI|nr:hypothetical protein [Thermus filiformis]KIX84834.1 hypothetical protein THFILI_00260 [Thermus filiformis]
MKTGRTGREAYPWQGYEWEALYRLSVHPRTRGAYRYGLLIPGPPQSKPRAIAHHPWPWTRLYRVPEGWLVLSREPEVAGYTLEDLSQRPIRTGPFLLLWGRAPWDGEARFRFLVSPRWVREKARYIDRVTRGLTWPAGKPKAPLQVIKAVNEVTREVLAAWEAGGFLPYPTANRWDKTVRRRLWRFLTGTAHLPGREARALMKRGVLLLTPRILGRGEEG